MEILRKTWAMSRPNLCGKRTVMVVGERWAWAGRGFTGNAHTRALVVDQRILLRTLELRVREHPGNNMQKYSWQAI